MRHQFYLFVLVAALASGCGTIAGYQASPRWRVVVTDANGEPRPECKVVRHWAYEFGRYDESGADEKTTDTRGEAMFDSVTIRPNPAKVWSGRAGGLIGVCQGYGPSSYVIVSKAGFERMDVFYPAGIKTSNGVAVARLVLMPPRRPDEILAAVRSGDLAGLRDSVERNRYYVTNDAQGAALLHSILRSSNESPIKIQMIECVAQQWKSARPPGAPKRLLVAETYVSEYRRTPLESAVSLKNVELVEALLTAGASPNPDWRYFYPSNPPLHLAVETGSTEMVKLLLRYKADVNLRRFQVGTALEQAEKAGQTEIADLLRQVQQAKRK